MPATFDGLDIIPDARPRDNDTDKQLILLRESIGSWKCLHRSLHSDFLKLKLEFDSHLKKEHGYKVNMVHLPHEGIFGGEFTDEFKERLK